MPFGCEPVVFGGCRSALFGPHLDLCGIFGPAVASLHVTAVVKTTLAAQSYATWKLSSFAQIIRIDESIYDIAREMSAT